MPQLFTLINQNSQNLPERTLLHKAKLWHLYNDHLSVIMSETFQLTYYLLFSVR